MNKSPLQKQIRRRPARLSRVAGNGEMAERIRNYPWSKTGLGPVETWAQSLLTSVNLMLQSPVPIVMLWGPDGIMIYNDAYSVFAGRRHPQLLGSTVVDGWPEVAEFNRNVMMHCLQGEALSYNDQQLILYRNGTPEEVWMDLNYSPIIDESGRPGGVLAIVTETTQRVLAEARERQAEAALKADLAEQYDLQEKIQKEVMRRRLLAQKTKLLRQQNRELTKLNATKNEFIALTSHQLRTPATGVKQYVAMLMQGYAGPITPEQEQFLERAYESNERQLHIIEDILRVAKIDMGKTQIMKQPYDMADLIQNALAEQTDRFAEHRLEIVTILPSQPVVASIDPSQLHMAIGNIVDNAIKYTPDGKKITVSLRHKDTDTIELTIKDEGVGIAKADIGKLFQKFSRIPNPRSIMVGGTGLGLYWTQRIIELHGGTIAVRSQLNRGTSFIITLPQK